MAFDGFDALPDKASDSITRWRVSIPQKKIDNLGALLKVTPIARPTFESSLPGQDRHLGLRHDWLVAAKRYWESEFDWSQHEAHINSFPHFKARVTDDLGDFDLHFVALFSRRKDAIPLLLLHGWPGSFVEFLPILNLVRSKYTNKTLPYHLIVPSLPGYTFSSPPPVNHDFGPSDAARIFDKLTSLLGFEAYMVQGGDLGGRIARIMAAECPNCRAVHLNTGPMPEPGPESWLSADVRSPINEAEAKGLERHRVFLHNGSAYAHEHATRPSTIGFVLSSSPLALLAWVGEKFLDWTDVDPPLDQILVLVTLYWVTGCAATSLWAYRRFYGPNAYSHGTKKWYIAKPFGFSWFPREITPVPRAWVETTGHLSFYRQHESGGHFAAMERPCDLWSDIEDFSTTINAKALFAKSSDK